MHGIRAVRREAATKTRLANRLDGSFSFQPDLAGCADH